MMKPGWLVVQQLCSVNVSVREFLELLYTLQGVSARHVFVDL